MKPVTVLVIRPRGEAATEQIPSRGRMSTEAIARLLRCGVNSIVRLARDDYVAYGSMIGGGVSNNNPVASVLLGPVTGTILIAGLPDAKGAMTSAPTRLPYRPGTLSYLAELGIIVVDHNAGTVDD